MRGARGFVALGLLWAGCEEPPAERDEPRTVGCSTFDLNGDGEIDLSDYLILSQNYGQQFEGRTLDFAFFLEFSQFYGQTCEQPKPDINAPSVLVIGPRQRDLEQELRATGVEPTFTNADASTYEGLPAPYDFDVAILLPSEGDMPEQGQFRLTRHVESGGAFIGFADAAARYAEGQYQGLSELVLLEDAAAVTCGVGAVDFAQDVAADAEVRSLGVSSVSTCDVAVRSPDDIDPVRTVLARDGGVYMVARPIDTGTIVNFSGDPQTTQDWENVAMVAEMLSCGGGGALSGAQPAGEWSGEGIAAALGAPSCSTCASGSRTAPEDWKFEITEAHLEEGPGGARIEIYADIDVPVGRRAVARLSADDGGFHSDGPFEFFAGRPDNADEVTDPADLLAKDPRWEWHELIGADAAARVFEPGRYRNVLLTVLDTGIWQGPDCGFNYDTSEGQVVGWDNDCVDDVSHPDEAVYTVHPPVLWDPDVPGETVWGRHYLTGHLMDISAWREPGWVPELIPAVNRTHPDAEGNTVVIEYDERPDATQPDPHAERPYPYRWTFDAGRLREDDPFAAAGRLCWNAPVPDPDFGDAQGGPAVATASPNQPIGEVQGEFAGTVGRGWREDDGTYTPLPNDAKYLLRHLQNELRGVADIGIPERTMQRLERDGIVKKYRGPSKMIFAGGGFSGTAINVPGAEYYILEVGKNDSDLRNGCTDDDDPCPERRLLFTREARVVDEGHRGFLSWFRAKKYRYVYDYKRSAYTRHEFGKPQELIALWEEGVAAQDALTQATCLHTAAHIAIEFIPTAKFWGQWVDDEVEYTGLDAASDVLFLVGGAGEALKAINVAGKSGRWFKVRSTAQMLGQPIEFAAGAGELGVGGWEAAQGLAAARNNKERAFAVMSGLLPAGGLGITYLKLSKVPGTRTLLTRAPGTGKVLRGIDEWRPDGIRVLEHREGSGAFEGIWVVEYEGEKYAMKLPALGDDPTARRAEIWEAIDDVQRNTAGLRHGPTNALGVIEHLDRSQLEIPDGMDFPDGDLLAFFDPLYPIDEKDCINKFVEMEGDWNTRTFQEISDTKYISEDAMNGMVAQLDAIAGEVSYDGGKRTITRMSHRDPNTRNLLMQVQKERRKVELEVRDGAGVRTVTQEVDVVIDVHVAAIDYHGPPNIENWRSHLVDKIVRKDDWVKGARKSTVVIDDAGNALLDTPLDLD